MTKKKVLFYKPIDEPVVDPWTGLFCYLRLNGNYIDSKGTFNFAAGGTGESFITAKSGDGLVFEANSVMNGPSNAAFNFSDALGDNDYSFSFWIKPTVSVFSDVFAKVDEYRCFITGGNKLRFQMFDSADSNLKRRIDSVTTIVADTWYHIQYTHISGVLKLYINGVSEGTMVDVGSYVKMPVTTNIVTVGGFGTGIWFKGLIDGFGFHNIGNTPAIVTSVFNKNNAGEELV